MSKLSYFCMINLVIYVYFVSNIDTKALEINSELIAHHNKITVHNGKIVINY